MLFPFTPTLLEFLAAAALAAFLGVVALELWLVHMALTIVVRTPVLRALVPVERRAPRSWGVRRRNTWWI